MIPSQQIPLQILKAIKLLNQHGYEAFLVGGSVRDLLSNKIPLDFDLTTSATPEQTMQVFEGYRVIPIGLKFGTVLVIIDKMQIEITTYRVEAKYSDARRPDLIQFSTDLIADLRRRDFTINAMAYYPLPSGNQQALSNKSTYAVMQNDLIDPFDGYQDLKNKIIRTVGNPEERFSEDALRILRALRFAANFGFTIEEKTALAIHKLKLQLNKISKERINSEFSQIMLSANLQTILFEFRDIFTVFIPELADTFDFNQRSPYHEYDVFRHTIEVVCNTPPELDLRLAALYHDIGKPLAFSVDDEGIGHFYKHPQYSAEIARNNMQDLKFEKKLIDTVENLVLYHDYPLELNEIVLKRRLHKFGEEFLRKLIILKKADITGKTQRIQNEQIGYLNKISLMLDEIILTKPTLRISDLQISGYDAIALGLEGSQIGEALNLVFEQVLEGKVKNNRDDLLATLKIIANDIY